MSIFFFFSSRRRHTRFDCDWSSDVCSSDLEAGRGGHDADRRVRLVVRRPHDHVAHRALSDLGGGGGGGSGERRVGEEGRSRGSPDPLKKKKKKRRYSR